METSDFAQYFDDDLVEKGGLTMGRQNTPGVQSRGPKPGKFVDHTRPGGKEGVDREQFDHGQDTLANRSDTGSHKNPRDVSRSAGSGKEGAFVSHDRPGPGPEGAQRQQFDHGQKVLNPHAKKSEGPDLSFIRVAEENPFRLTHLVPSDDAEVAKGIKEESWGQQPGRNLELEGQKARFE